MVSIHITQQLFRFQKKQFPLVVKVGNRPLVMKMEVYPLKHHPVVMEEHHPVVMEEHHPVMMEEPLPVSACMLFKLTEIILFY